MSCRSKVICNITRCEKSVSGIYLRYGRFCFYTFLCCNVNLNMSISNKIYFESSVTEDYYSAELASPIMGRKTAYYSQFK
ncbi:hypothetical protein VNO77_21524 [Canavalia gladiata]|uniref:Uncharacterized protein n=1 Tax=Canavalia gladiata TaxID=3824 RepID=A0AAN9LS66_CANGL